MEVATVLTVYGIETWLHFTNRKKYLSVATVLTVYGIETCAFLDSTTAFKLQQYLPFTVLKRDMEVSVIRSSMTVATVLTVYGIETNRPSFAPNTT